MDALSSNALPQYLAVSGFLDSLVDLPVCRALRFCITFIVILLAPAETKLDLAAAVLVEIYRKRDKCKTLLRLESSVQLAYLFAVHQKSAHSERINIVSVALLIRRNMHACDYELTLAGDLGKALLDTDSAPADRFDLSTCEYDACLVSFLDEIIVEGFLVIRDHFSAFFCHC